MSLDKFLMLFPPSAINQQSPSDEVIKKMRPLRRNQNFLMIIDNFQGTGKSSISRHQPRMEASMPLS